MGPLVLSHREGPDVTAMSLRHMVENLAMWGVLPELVVPVVAICYLFPDLRPPRGPTLLQ